MGGNAVDGSLQLEALGPLREVRPWPLHSVMELVGSRVAADLPRSEAVSSLEVLRFHTLVVDCALAAELVVVVGVGVGPRHFEDFLLGSRLLVAGTSALCEVGFVGL